ncbi:trehalase family glycosidase [Acidipila sp. EB88]|uniref:MGH1-like glycoside hydrolase domain-containing protein n=1 Tax=Acidipila sp. EB88 TaxID=2305226 RepID=UPI000F6024C4|nr:trehalase family glycosidase [Acidipila sp. EB88]RRA48250.1 hypothetical protein D1Y84_08055 [Acidipila sp. EB88]
MHAAARFAVFPHLFTLALIAGITPGIAATQSVAQQPATTSRPRPDTPPSQASTLPRAATFPLSPQYLQLQQRLAQGWNTWDVHSVTTHVLLPDGIAIHLGLKHNTTESGEAFLGDTLIGRLDPHAEQVVPGPHAWDGAYTDLSVTWHGHNWRVESAHSGPQDLVLVATPLPSGTTTALPPTLAISVDLLWNQPGTITKTPTYLAARTPSKEIRVYCSCAAQDQSVTTKATVAKPSATLPVTSPYFAADFNQPIVISTGQPRSLAEARAILEQQHNAYTRSLTVDPDTQPITDAIQTTLGWDTIYEPEAQRVISPVSRIWSVDWGGYVLFDWDTFFAATMASTGDRDLAYADTIETLRESTDQGFVPNYARGGNWKSFDRSEPPVGAITVLGLYRKFHDLWFLEQCFPALLKWNQWWADHRDIQGYLAWGSDGNNPPGNLDDNSRGTGKGAILESGLDNSPMYDTAAYDADKHVLAFADVGLMSMYIADCDALATIADELHRPQDARALRERSTRYTRALQTLWSPADGIFLNKDLRTAQPSHRLSPTNFYPLLSRTATPAQAHAMITQHLLNPQEFWGAWVLPSIARNDPAFPDQDYWRGRIWGPLNYLVYLGLANYNEPAARAALAQKSYDLFLKEWRDHGHVHENYNATLGTGDDVSNSDRFYHWGALLGYVQYLEATHQAPAAPSPAPQP